MLCLTRPGGGFGPGTLGIGQMAQLLDELGITDRTTRLETIDHLLALDRVYLQWSQDGDRH